MSEVIQAGTIQRRKRFYEMSPGRRKLVVEVIAALFILLFLYTALSKSFMIGSTVDVIKRTPFFSNFPKVTAWSVVVVEYAVAALLFFPQTRKAGLYSSLVIMLGFTLYIGYMKAVIPRLPCSCGGVISTLTWNQHLVFNIFFALLAGYGIRLMGKSKSM
jgi:hypothetical protein